MNNKTGNNHRWTVTLDIPFSISTDDAWDWVDQQDIATIHDITADPEHQTVSITPLWFDDITREVETAWFESICDYFAEKMQ